MGNLVAAMILTTIPVSAYGAQSVSAGGNEVLAEESILVEESEAVLPAMEEELPVIDREEMTVDEPESVISEDGELPDSGLSESGIIEVPETIVPESTDWNSENSLPEEAGSYTLSSDVTLYYDAWEVRQDITLDLNGHTITRVVQANGDGQSVIQIMEGSLTLNDSVGTGKITGEGAGINKCAQYGGGVFIGDGCSFTMNGGKITGNKAKCGAGVCVGYGGSFTMNDGEICDNETIVEGNGQGYGGGVYVSGTGKSASFNMIGGRIYNNKATYDGGGVYIFGEQNTAGTVFIITGGEITGNSAKKGGGVSALGNVSISCNGGVISGNESSETGGGVNICKAKLAVGGEAKIMNNTTKFGGGGVRIDGGTVSISGNAMISGNRAEYYGGGIHVHREYIDDNTAGEEAELFMSGGTIRSNSAPYGGGVHVDEAKFDMTEGTIEENTASGSIDDKEKGYGGGVFISSDSFFTMKGGKIVNNNAKSGGGISTSGESTFELTDGSIEGNTGNSGVGGVDVNGGLVIMTGGSIKGNTGNSGAGGIYFDKGTFTLKGGSIENNKGTYGGGIRVSDGIFNMSGAEVKGNEATQGGGGGLYIAKGSDVTVSGGKIIGNSSKNYWSGGVYYDKEVRFNVSGNLVIYDNYNGGTLENGLYTGGNRADIHTGNESEGYKVVTVIGALTDGATIGLCGECGVAVAEGGNGYTLTESDKAKIVSDYSDNGRHWDMELDNGKLFMGMPMSYVTVSPNKIPDQTYTGTPIEPDLKVMDGETELEKDVQYTVSYTDNINVGTVTVIIKAKHRDGNDRNKMYYAGSIPKTFNIVKARFTDTDINRAPKYGMSDSVDLSRFYKDDVTVGTISVTDTDSILESCALTNKVLGFKVKNDHKLTGKKAEIVIPVTGGNNFESCTIKVTVTVIPDENCTELADDIKKEEGNKNTPVSANTVDKGEDGKETSITVGGEEVSKVTVDKDGKVSETTRIWVSGIEKGYKYTGEAIKPEIHVYDGTKKLTAGTDYSVSYSSNKAAGNDTAKIRISFKGSYAGTPPQTLRFTIIPAELDKDVIVTPVTIAANNREQKPVPVITMKETGKKLSSGIFKYEYDRTVKAPGSYTVTIRPKDNNRNFTEKTTATITVTDNMHLLSKASVKLAEGKAKNFTYTGKELPAAADRKGRYILTIKSGRNTVTLKEDTDYKVEYSKNVAPGTALVTFTGMGDYIGTKTATFKIVKGRSLKDSEGIKVTFADGRKSAPYAKGGAKPEIKVTDNGTELTLGKDYTVSYSKNKEVTSGETAIAKVKGKGNYKDTVELNFAVTTRNISDLSEYILVNDKIKSNKADGYKNPTVVITDLDGRKLRAKTDFVIEDDYTTPGADGKVTVTIKGNGNYGGTYKASYRYIDADKNIGKVKAKAKIPNQTYTGKEIIISDEVLNKILFAGDTPLIKDQDFEVVSYEKNIKKGTAKILLKGKGSYGGTRTLTFKITAKKGSYMGALKGGEWK